MGELIGMSTSGSYRKNPQNKPKHEHKLAVQSVQLSEQSCFWTEGGGRRTRREPLHKQGRTCTLHMKKPWPREEPGPSCCKPTVPTTGSA
ncbi:hypothetical protein ILYODFUR_009710 [Ilyodon furcidens]|uniref:Uncharacterized protein n=1 Tax=Ilyodon furcidens TaxID=33524 RepID=A0ABV0T6M1_9TELE